MCDAIGVRFETFKAPLITMRMTRSYVAWLLPVALSIGNPLAGQQTQPAKPDPNIGTSALERSVRKIGELFQRPLHPTFKGVAPGGGLGAGLAYDAPPRGPWKTTAAAVFTIRRYWSAEVITGYYDRRGEAEAFARARDMTRLDYYGPGSDSRLSDRTDFQLRDPLIGARGRVRLHPWVAIGGRVEEIWPDVGHGRSSAVPSIEQRFPAASGLISQPRFGRYEGLLDVHIPPGVGESPYQGTKVRVTHAIYSDQELDRFSFNRTDIEAQQRFALIAPHHRLTLHGLVSMSVPKSGDDVPFYLQRTLGGNSDVHSIHEERIGSDGTQGTLRGFRNLRFRDRNLLLLQAEYRIPIWGPFDATVFTDGGKVTRRRGDLDLADLKHDFGFSLSVMKGAATAARIDVGLGGGEGTRLFFTLGNVVR
jgi:hypothetical protein